MTAHLPWTYVHKPGSKRRDDLLTASFWPPGHRCCVLNSRILVCLVSIRSRE